MWIWKIIFVLIEIKLKPTTLTTTTQSYIYPHFSFFLLSLDNTILHIQIYTYLSISSFCLTLEEKSIFLYWKISFNK